MRDLHCAADCVFYEIVAALPVAGAVVVDVFRNWALRSDE